MSPLPINKAATRPSLLATALAFRRIFWPGSNSLIAASVEINRAGDLNV